MRINVALATDKNYLRYTFVTMYSVMNHAKSDDIYYFYILTDNDIYNEIDEYICDMKNKYAQCEIKVIDAEPYFGEVTLSIPHITKPTYYRLIIPNCVIADKCIYLDSDIIVLNDLRSLFELEIGGYEVAGVLATAHQIVPEYGKIIKEQVGLYDLNSYINAGVLLMNLREMRRRDFVNRSLRLVENDYPTNDQDIINLVCYDDIFCLPYTYNVQINRLNFEKEQLRNVYGKQDFDEAIKNPCIIHYSTSAKPWEKLNLPYSELWWNECSRVPFYEKLFFEQKNFFIYYSIVINMSAWKKRVYTKRWFKDLRNFKNIYMYGAGWFCNKVVSKIKSRINIDGILVSNLDENVEYVSDIKIIQYSEAISKDSLILISSLKYEKQIFRKLILDGYLYVISLCERL